MESLVTVFGPIVFVVLFTFGLVIAVLYLLLPFAIFGIKPLLRNNITAIYKQNHLLKKQINLLDEQVTSLNDLFKTPE